MRILGELFQDKIQAIHNLAKKVLLYWVLMISVIIISTREVLCIQLFW
jgi:hypothetical protein